MIEKSKTYNNTSQYTHESKNCVIGSMGNYFSNFNSKFDDSFCFFVLEKFVLSYTKSGKNVSDIHISHHVAEAYSDLAAKFGLESDLRKSTRHNLKKLLLCKNTPLIIELNSRNLSYHHLYKTNKWNFPHFITILELNNNNAVISDCYIPKINDSEIYEGKADIKNLQKAWKKGGYWYYDSLNVSEFISEFIIDYNFCKTLFNKNISTLLNSSIPTQELFAKDFSNYLNLYDIKDIKKNLQNICIQIQALGLIASRYYLKKYLITHLQFQNSEFINFIDTDINEWHKICLAIYKCTLTCSKESFDQVQKLIINISEKERNIYSKLQQKIN